MCLSYSHSVRCDHLALQCPERMGEVLITWLNGTCHCRPIEGSATPTGHYQIIPLTAPFVPAWDVYE